MRLAHRGDWREAPENSLAAMEAALRVPACDGLEFDVRSSKDGVPVLLHDETLARVQRIPAKCVALTADELAAHGVPLLGDVLKAVGRDPFLDVELKEATPGAIDILELERGRIGDDGRPDLHNAVVSAFEVETLRWLGDLRPTWPRWLNAYDLSPATVDLAIELGCEAISAEWHSIDAAGVARASDAGLRVAAFTIRAVGAYEAMERLGVAAICAEAEALDG